MQDDWHHRNGVDTLAVNRGTLHGMAPCAVSTFLTLLLAILIALRALYR
jgi:hypothetical protein